ncbi:MAG: hypothetical protein WC780_12145 [Lentimicrobiaceae bacterium]|jgi:hypothetical protein
MKKILLIAAMAIFMSCQGLWANQANDFKYNKQQVQDEFSDLNLLEQTVIDNSFITLSEMQSKNILSSKFSNLNLTTMMMEPALGIPGFWWGCVLGPVGILVVYLVTDNDRPEVKKALYGCLVSAGFWIIWEVVWVVALGNGFWAY